jgi:hypothetical protein
LQGQLLEPRFVSTTPVVGTALVSVRRFWNWMSTKWYLRPILRQQSEFNALLVDRVVEVERQLRSLAVQAPNARPQRGGEEPGGTGEPGVEARPAGSTASPELEQRLRQIESRLAEIERRLDGSMRPEG